MLKNLFFDCVTFMATSLSSLVAAMSMLEGTGKGQGGRFQLSWVLESQGHGMLFGQSRPRWASVALMLRWCLSAQVLVRTELQGIRYKFNAPIGRDTSNQYSWHYTPWTKCSVLCAGGEA